MRIHKSRITYATVYGHAFRHRERFESLVRHRLSPASPPSLRERLHWSRHILKMLRTQSWARPYQDSPLASFVWTQHRLAHLAAVVTHLRPLQRRILDFLYRPRGPLMRRSMRRALRAASPPCCRSSAP